MQNLSFLCDLIYCTENHFRLLFSSDLIKRYKAKCDDILCGLTYFITQPLFACFSMQSIIVISSLCQCAKVEVVIVTL